MTDHPKPTDPCWSRLPVYRPGGKLTADQLNAGVADALARDRMLNLGLHGTGIIYGFDLKRTEDGDVLVKDNSIHIGCGLALDRRGRMIYWPGGWLCYDQIIGCEPETEGCYTLRVHYAERADRGRWDRCEEEAGWIWRCAAFTLEKGCHPDDLCPDNLPEDPCLSRRDFICERISKWPEHPHGAKDLEFACAEPPPLETSRCGRYGYEPEAGLALTCVRLCREAPEDDNCPPGLRFCPCGEESKEDCDDDHEKGKRKQAEAARAEAAANAGSDPLTHGPVGQVHPTPPGLQRPGYGDDKPEEDCGCDNGRDCGCGKHSDCDLRRFAYRAPLLYELLNDADVHLSRVAWYSWSQWTLGLWDARMPLAEFKARTDACEKGGEVGHRIRPEDLAEGLFVLFTRPVQAETLHELSVLMDVYTHAVDSAADGREKLVAWLQERVPAAIQPVRRLNDEAWVLVEDGLADGVRICPSEAWRTLRRKYLERCATRGKHARVEITLRGQMIRDDCGCMLDARPPELTCRDHCGSKTGQARPGGDFVAPFRVGPDPDDKDDDGRSETAAPTAQKAAFTSSRNGETS